METTAIQENLVHKYRPKNLDDMILPARIKNKLLEKGVYQHLLFHGSPGNGKTSTALAVCHHFGLPYDLINASEETSVDVVRERINSFCSTFSLVDGADKPKIPILDEFDGVSDQFNKAIKATMERFKRSRFIATTNHINKIPLAVRSRFELISFDFTDQESDEIYKGYLRRVYEICTAEGLSITKDALVELVKRKFPDLRSILVVLESILAEGRTEITIDDITKSHSVYKDVFELIFNNIDTVKNYQYMVSEYSHIVDEILSSLGDDFIEYIQLEKPTHIKHIPQIIVAVAEHQAQRLSVIDPVITMLSCVYTCQNIIHGIKK